MKNILIVKYITCILFLLIHFDFHVFAQEQDIVEGNLVQFNENGAWCWYQDERAVVDRDDGKLVVGSVASGSGLGGYLRNGDIDAVILDLNTMTSQKFLLKNGGGNAFYGDDHNAPVFLVRPDGKYLAVYAAHFNDTSSYYHIYDGDDWGAENRFDWNLERPGGSNFQTTYSNVYYLSDENRTYNFARTNNKSPNSMISSDMGDSWTYGGQLAYGSNIGYNNGYYKYNGNGVDRNDFVCTEYHPRDYNTSIYHGYIKGGKSYQSDGTLVDGNIFDVTPLPDASDFTLVFAAGTQIGNRTINRCWNMDVQRYPDGTIATIISGRIDDNTYGNDNNINPAHCFIYCRYNGSNWSFTYLGQAGPKLYSPEADYTGLAALHPANPHVIYISTTIDPRDDKDLGVHEIFRGETSDYGVTWTWTQITMNSTRDNLRPIIPAWDEENTALLWMRGVYSGAGAFDLAVVGILDKPSETIGLMTYIDANAGNTQMASGSAFNPTGPDGNRGPADNQWHERTGFGNGGSVFTSSENEGEDAPVLKTTITPGNSGVYDVWVHFWANPLEDWRIKAGLKEDAMQIYRHMVCKQVDDQGHTEPLVLTGGGNTYFYQAYIGRLELSSDESFDVYVDDHSVRTGSTSVLEYSWCRTWYDGISYAEVETGTNQIAEEKTTLPSAFILDQNYPNPLNPTTTISFSLPKRSDIRLVLFNVLGKEVMRLAEGTFEAGQHRIQLNASHLAGGVYFYRMETGNYMKMIKMVIIK